MRIDLGALPGLALTVLGGRIEALAGAGIARQICAGQDGVHPRIVGSALPGLRVFLYLYKNVQNLSKSNLEGLYAV